MKIKHINNENDGRQLLVLTSLVGLASIVMIVGKAFAGGDACYGIMQPDGDPLHYTKVQTIICNTDCSGVGYCYEYWYDPDGKVPRTCTDDAGFETGSKCEHDNVDVTKGGKNGTPICFLKEGSTNECTGAGECRNWRTITNEVISVPQDSTSSWDCRPKP